MTSRRLATLLCAAFSLTLLSAPAFAQTDAGSPTPSIVPDVAVPAAGAPSGREIWGGGSSLVMVSPLWLGASAHVGVERGPTVVKIGLSGAGAFWGSESTTALSVIGGVQGKTGPLVVAALAGPAAVWGRTASDDQRATRFGGVAEVSAMLEIKSRVRLGAEAHASVTPAGTTLGVGPALRVRLGR